MCAASQQHENILASVRSLRGRLRTIHLSLSKNSVLNIADDQRMPSALYGQDLSAPSSRMNDA